MATSAVIIDPSTGEREDAPQIDPGTGERIGTPTPKPPALAPVHVTPDVASDMFKAGVHSKMLGVTPAAAYDGREEIDKTLRERGGDYDGPELDSTISNDIKVGLEGSVLGLMKRNKLPEQVSNPGMLDKFVTGLAQTVADVPAMLAGGAAGGAAASETVVGTPFGAAAGAFGIPAVMREALVQGIKNGKVTSFSDLLRRSADVVWAGAKGAITGAATEAAGGLPVGFLAKSPVTATAVKGLYQATALTTTADLLEGHLPTAKDFAGNAALIIPLNLITHGVAMRQGEANQALMDVYAKNGKPPRESAETLGAQPPVKPDLPEGLKPAIQLTEGHVEGDTSENHADLAERALAKKPVSMEQLEANPKKADTVLETPAIHEQDVIDRAWTLKKEAIDAGEVETVYHGTKASFDEFGLSQRNTNSPDSEGIYFTRDREMAQNFADTAKGEGSPRVIEASLGIKKPYDWNADPEGLVAADEMSTTIPPSYISKGFRAKLEAEGYDGVHWTPKEGEHDEWVVFDPKKIVQTRADKPLAIEDLYDRASMKSGRGFVTPDGKFLSRMEARKWVKDNEPDVHEMWLNEQDGDKQAELHSEDYASARQRVQARSVAEGDSTIANVSPENARRLAAARVGLNKIKAGEESKGYGKEVLRTLFAGQRDSRIAATTQLRDSLKKLIPDFHDQEALSILRDYKGTPDKLAADLEEIRNGDSERMKALIPSIERAMNPSPALLEADQKLTGYYTSALSEGQQLGFMESKIDPANYSPHILTRILDVEKPSGKGAAMSQTTPFAKERSYPTILDALKTGHLDARTVNALDALSIYGDRHATVVATKLLATELKNTELGKYGTREDHPDSWVELAPGQQSLRQGGDSLYVPKEVADALKPMFEPGLKDTPLAPLLKSQGYVKALELGLSLFHVKALNITAFNNIGLTDFTKALISDTKTPEFAEAERGWAADGLTTAKTSTPYEAYEGLKKSSIPTGFDKLANAPIIKQADALFKAATEYTFEVVQRKFKVQDASLKSAKWLANHSDATNEEYFAARRSIAKEVNAAYGGLNWDVLGTGKTVRDVSRLFLLAPDWTFSNVLNAKYTFEGGPAGSAARMFWAKSFATGFAMTAAVSIATGGKYDPTDIKHIDQVYLGTDKDGKEMYANWFFAGAPKDAITLVKRSASDSPIAGTAEFVVSKASPALGILQGLDSNKQGSGAPISKASDSTGEKAIKQGEFVAQRVIPITGVSAVKTVVDALTDPNHEYSYKDLLNLAADALGSPTTHQGSGKGSSGGDSTKRFQSAGGKSRFSIRSRK
jgi:ADP-Ribosyltransferase in polyvalent proteins